MSERYYYFLNTYKCSLQYIHVRVIMKRWKGKRRVHESLQSFFYQEKYQNSIFDFIVYISVYVGVYSEAECISG